MRHLLDFVSPFLVALAVFVRPTDASSKVQSVDSPAIQQSTSTLPAVLRYGLEHSLDQRANGANAKAQELVMQGARQARLLPQMTASAAYQKIQHDEAKSDTNGNLTSNNGHSTSLGLTVTYDLQKLLGPEVILAQEGFQIAKLQQKIATRDLVRNIKRSYYTVSELQAEIGELAKVIALFDRVQSVLHRQKRIGIDNSIELQQFEIQQSILKTDMETRTAELETAFASLSTLINADVSTTKSLIGSNARTDDLHFVERTKNITDLKSDFGDRELIEFLSRDYNMARLEYEKYRAVPLPSLYAKLTRDLPTYYSSDGPQTTAEIGLTFPIDAVFTRSTQKSLLGANAEKSNWLNRKAIQEYQNQVRLDVANLSRLKEQATLLNTTLTASSHLLDRAFVYYSQKRLDVLGTLDVFSKYLQASHNSLTNKLQVSQLDAELEYLLGGSDK